MFGLIRAQPRNDGFVDLWYRARSKSGIGRVTRAGIGKAKGAAFQQSAFLLRLVIVISLTLEGLIGIGLAEPAQAVCFRSP